MVRCQHLLAILFASLGVLAGTHCARAQTSYVWNTDASASWNTASNWNPSGIPNGQGVEVLFGNAINANRTIFLDNDVSVGSISFENSGLFSYTIGGSGILTLDNALNPASITVASNVLAGQTITRLLVAQSDVNITNNTLSGFLTLSGGLNLGGHTLTVSGPGSVNFSNNPITGTTGSRLVLNGPGAVYLSSINNGIRYEVSGGTLVAFSADSLQSLQAGVLTPDLVTLTNGGAVNFHVEQTQRNFVGIVLGTGGGRIDSDASGPVILSAPITGSGSLTKTGPQTIALAATNTYTGETIIRQGALRIDVNAPGGSAGALGNATSAVILGDNVGGNSTALYIGGNGVSVGRDIAVVSSPAPGTSTVTIGVRPADVSATVSGSFSGPLTLNRSVVLSVIGGTGSSVGFGRITGTGDITVGGVGTVTFNSSLSDFVGSITLDSGTLSINDDAKLGAATNNILFKLGTLRATGSTPFSTNRDITLILSGTSGSKVEVSNTDSASGFTINSAITGAGPFRKTGPGILTFAGANTFGTTTYVETGTLRAAAANVLSPNSYLAPYAGATVKLNGFSQQVAALADGTTNSAGTIDLGSNPATVLTVGRDGASKGPILFQGSITGVGNLVFTGFGSQWMGGTSSYLGTTTVRQGILELRASVPSAGNGPLGDAAGGAIRLGDANFASFDAAIVSSDQSSAGFARPITVVAGSGKRSIGHRLHGTSNDGKIITFSGNIALEKDLHLYSLTTNDYVGADLRVSGVVSGAGGLVKIGGGEARLTADNTYSGTTTILNGRLVLGGPGLADAAARSSAGVIVRNDWSDPGIPLDTQFSPAPTDKNYAEFVIQDFAPNTNRLGDVDVTLAQGKFAYLGQDAGASSESFRNLTLERGANTLEVTTPVSSSTTSATLSMTGGFDRQNRATLRVIATGLGNPDGGDFTRVLAASPPALVGGGGAAGSTNISIVPWAFHSTGPDVTPVRNFLTYGPTGLRPLAASEYVVSLTAEGDLNNVRITSTSTTLGQNQTINALFYDNTANGTITLTGQTLTVNSGAILSTSGNLTFDGGTVAFGSAEGIIHSTDYSNVTINSAISGSGGLTSHVGFGSTLTLNGINTYTGPTTINSGHVAFNSAASFGSGGDPIRFHFGATGSTMTYTGSGATTLPNPIEIGPSITALRLGNGGTLTLTGVISGTSTETIGDALTFASVTGAGTFELRAANTFTGNVRLISGTLGIVADNNLGASSNRFTLGSGTSNNPTLRFDAADITLARPITIGGNAAIRTNTGFDATISGPITGADYTYTLTKTGAGTLTLTGTHTYGATTQVSAGTLLVNGTLASSFSAGLLHVNNGGTLGGSGTVGRLVNVNSGGTLAPGAGTGTLTLGALQFASGATATYPWEAGASVQDQIVVTSGTVNLTGISITLGLYDRGLGTNVTPDQQFPILTVAGANSITGFNPANFNVVFADTPNWSTSQYSLTLAQIGGNTALVLTNIAPVPEPAGLLALSGLVLAFAVRQRRETGGCDKHPLGEGAAM
jgi:autotransporter-associated beta strand protein